MAHMTEDPVQKPDPDSDWVILGSNIFDEGGIGLVLIGMGGEFSGARRMIVKLLKP